MEISKGSNFSIEYWMCSSLGLKAAELLVFAMIYSYSRNNQPFFGSIEYMSKWLNYSEPSIVTALKNLTAKGFITKSLNSHVGYVSKYTYSVNKDIFNKINII